MAPPLVEAMYHAQRHGIAGPVRGLTFQDQLAWNATNMRFGWEMKPLSPFNDDLYIVKNEPAFMPRLDYDNNYAFGPRKKKGDFNW